MRNPVIRTLARLAAVLALVLGATAAAAGPAHASLSSCPTSPLAYQFCVWDNPLYSGSVDYFWTIPPGSGGFCVNYGPGLNDNVDSLELAGGLSVTQYRHANCTGTAVSFTSNPGHLSCGSQAWACAFEGGGTYLPSSAWIIKKP